MQLNKDDLTADMINTNLGTDDCIAVRDIECVEKTYYKYVDLKFKGIVVGYVDVVTKGYLDVVYEDEVDVGVGIIPEKYYVTKTSKEVVRCAIVYYANNKKHLVPLTNIIQEEPYGI